MAIHCDVCKAQIFSATENGGSFPAPMGFVSAVDRRNKISDTCEPCSRQIRTMIDMVVNPVIEKIRREHNVRV